MGETDARVLKDQIRDAATVIVLRDTSDGPSVLMGQRGKNAAFMPSKFVFPGGAVDPADGEISPLGTPNASCSAALAVGSEVSAGILMAAATRELWEETGLLIGKPGPRPDATPEEWASYTATGHLPDAAAFEFVFRAITPPGRPRRFDARFFLADASALQTDPDDFSRAEDELSHLQWVPLAAARGFDMPFITEVVLAELSARLDGRASQGVPFFDNSGPESRFSRL